MKTLKALFVFTAILAISGYTFATGKGPGLGEVKSTVREKIASTIESSSIKEKGEVTLKFGITGQNNIKILDIESTNKNLSEEVKNVLTDTKVSFPEGSEGVYKIKVLVNGAKEVSPYNVVREQVYNAVEKIETSAQGTVNLKIRVIHPSKVMVLRAESTNPSLAKKVQNTLETEGIKVPVNLNGDYNIKVSFK